MILATDGWHLYCLTPNGIHPECGPQSVLYQLVYTVSLLCGLEHWEDNQHKSYRKRDFRARPSCESIL